MNALTVVLTVVVLVAVAAFVLLFEAKRARRIERDLRDQAGQGRHHRDNDRPT